MVPYCYLFMLSVYTLWFTARAFRKLLSMYVYSHFPFGYEGKRWDLIVSVPDHCLYFYINQSVNKSINQQNNQSINQSINQLINQCLKH